MDTKKLSTKEYFCFIKTRISDFIDDIKYLHFRKPINDRGTPPANLYVMWDYNKKEKSFYAECVTHPGIYTVGSTPKESIINLNDAAYKYFGVPRFLAKRYGLMYNPPLEAFDKLIKIGAPIKLRLKRNPQPQYAPA